MNTHKILVIEDEVKIAQLLKDYLEGDGYSVTLLHDGSHAVEEVKTKQPDFILLDLMLPGKDGISICKEVRQFSDVPIMMLTARVDEIDRLLGLELGADDYLCKPFSPREVVVRVRTILRRVKSQQQPESSDNNELNYKGVQLLTDRFQCLANHQMIELTPVEFRMLGAMIKRPGRVFSRDSLARLIYKDERIVSNRTIDSHIKNLRKKLSSAMADKELIHSIYGVGYKCE
ncbi:MAG: response regulator [Arenicella sp.]